MVYNDGEKMTSNNSVNSNKITILHYNDVYNIDSNTSTEPIGGASRFCTAIRSFHELNPLVLFSGDAFSPSMREFFLFFSTSFQN